MRPTKVNPSEAPYSSFYLLPTRADNDSAATNQTWLRLQHCEWRYLFALVLRSRETGIRGALAIEPIGFSGRLFFVRDHVPPFIELVELVPGWSS